ncbi:MAG: RagB/SusD family nutrient uptake outer membrane protein [Prevotella sp.]|nr:RagB/SusD family nutrient uptake outer membrane protein [Prevotella sp.]MBP3827781.1 RagB/SusD family nutrient uptake outer membrane protein [Prevotella sp.]
MKRQTYINNLLGLVCCCITATLTLTSCDDYLDKMPDNRTEIDNEEKIGDVLVSAYPTTHYAVITEMMSDNTDENAGNYTTINKLQEEMYRWQDATFEDTDSPFMLWQASYKAISSANTALAAIEEQGNPSYLDAERGEALMCRAYNHFVLVNIFCKHYSQKTSSSDMGIPYMKEIESTVAPYYDRGTVAQVYENIRQDIETALPLINDASYEIPKYHFNRKAAYAFAARFWLYYVQPDKSNYRKVIECANEVLGEDPLTMLRDWKTVGALTPNNNVRPNEFIQAEHNANLMMYSTFSLWARTHGPYGIGEKFCHNPSIAAYETCRRASVWGGSGNLYYTIPQYSGTPKVIMCKTAEYFEYTDVNAGIGHAHIMFLPFTSDETLLCRAEAYTMLEDYDHALEDINLFTHNFTKFTGTVTEATMNTQYGSNVKYYEPSPQTAATPKKALNPDFEVKEGTQETFIHGLLHMRRVLTLHDGLRWFDVKRYGIKIYRRIINSDNTVTLTDSLLVDDPRRAVQLPAPVIKAGLPANPR